MATVYISGEDLAIYLVCGVGETAVAYSVQDIYEQWKEWTQIGDNLKFPPAMSSAGGEPLGGGERLGSAFFLNAGYGWRIVPDVAEAQVKITLNGNLFASPATDPLFSYVGVLATIEMQLRTSTLPTIMETGVSGLTPEESAVLASRAAQGSVDAIAAAVASALVEIIQSRKLLEADQVFDVATGLLRTLERGTTTDLVPAKRVTGSSQTQDAEIVQP